MCCKRVVSRNNNRRSTMITRLIVIGNKLGSKNPIFHVFFANKIIRDIVNWREIGSQTSHGRTLPSVRFSVLGDSKLSALQWVKRSSAVCVTDENLFLFCMRVDWRCQRRNAEYFKRWSNLGDCDWPGLGKCGIKTLLP